MQRLTILLSFLLVAGSVWAQQAKVYLPADKADLSTYRYIDYAEVAEPVVSATVTSQVPLGTATSDAVSVVKIAESSNIYTKLLDQTNQVAVRKDIGTNGGTVAFIYRQNIANCGGVTEDNGRYRYSISSDGGTTWKLGAAGTNTVGNPLPPSGCYGIGTINPLYTRFGRYPNIVMGQNPGTTDSTGLYLVHSGPVITSAQSWDNLVFGKVDNILDPANSQVVQESYPYNGGPHYFIQSLTERVPGEYWGIGRSWDGANPTDVIRIHKGVYNATTNSVDWTVTSLSETWSQTFDGSARFASPQICFSPDGTVGYMATVGDLAGGVDSVYNVIIWESTNGGLTWSAPEEIPLQNFQEVKDALDFFVQADPNNPGQTLPWSIGSITAGFDIDLTVDANGNPHVLCSAHNIGINDLTDPTNRLPNYSVRAQFGSIVVDVTTDSFGDYSGVILANQRTFRGTFGNTSRQPEGEFTQDLYLQASRTSDGSKVLFLWTDSDTVGTNQSSDNNNPDLVGVGWDLTANRLTALKDFTNDDLTWGGQVITPQASPEALENANILTVPVTISSLVGIDALDPVDHWYFSDVNFDVAKDFTIIPDFFYNCKENPITINVTDNKPNCGAADGQITVAGAGGLGALDYVWSNNADSSTILGLSAGIYSVTITDTIGCSQTESVVLANANSPVIAVDSIRDINCFGANNGLAALQVTGGTGNPTFFWDTSNEITATATMLPPGKSTLTVTDSLGCQSFFEVDIVEPSEINVNTSFVDVLCNGESNGSASVVAFGGTGNLSYSWDNGSNTASITNVPAGDYTLTITDENNCVETRLITVAQPAPITVAFNATGNVQSQPPYDGTILVTPVGGVAPYENILSRLLQTQVRDTIAPSSGQSTFYNGLIACRYRMSIIDANGCTADTVISVDAQIIPGLPPAAVCLTSNDPFGNLSSFDLYPNPSNGVLTLSLRLEKAEAMQVEIYNYNGQLVQAQEVSATQTFMRRFDLSEYGKGIYLVKVSTDSGSRTQRVIIK